ncbi:Reverse transcriptase (RNA-dependent DNA polymerase) [Fragilaria crotonensis]|nr:Reverse transcriptase (RNA-dependent DNA polymerase) [Fragilaria crotonensis]
MEYWPRDGQANSSSNNPARTRVAQALTEFADDVFIPDSEIGELKKRWRNRMLKRKVPPCLWDYSLVYETNILNRIPRGQQLRTGIEIVTGEAPDMSEWIDFEFYNHVWYYDQKKIEIDGTGQRLARWLGVALRVGSDLCFWLLLESGKVIARTTVQHVVRDDYLNNDVKSEIESFDRSVDERLSDQNFMADPADGFYIQDKFNEVPSGTVRTEEDYGDIMDTPDTLDADDINDDVIDKYLNAELIFNVGTGSSRKGRVVKHAKGTSGEPIGRAHSNPLFDTREYVVEFTDRSTENYFANVIAECMYAQVDSEGNQYQLLSEITDHRSDNSAIQIADGFTTSCNGNRIPKSTTRGWSLLVSWKDGSSDWLPLKDLKDAYPVQVAEYAVEPVFNWWVHTVLRKPNRIVAKVKRYWQMTHKFGIRVPKTVEEALTIDEETGTYLWRKALVGKEMTKVNVAWKSADGITPAQARTGKEPLMIGFQEIHCHVIFDVKMDFTRKARRCNQCIINASCREKIWFEGGIETGEDRGKVLIVTRALYGLKSSGAAWRADLAATLCQMNNFTSTQADPDVWIRSAGTHYDMVLVYVDDILIFAKEPKQTMDELGKLYELKPESVHEPNIYLGANMEKVQLPNGKVEWAMGSKTYHVKNAIKVVEALITEDDPEAKLKSTARNPFPSGYKPELDLTPKLNNKMGSRFLQLIGILRWAIELGRLDIFVEVSQLSQHQALPRRGHLEALYHIFAYLKKHENGARIVFDPKTPEIDERVFNSDADWRGRLLRGRMQGTTTKYARTKSFGSEFVVLRAAKDMLVALRYKLRMFGVPIDGPANVFCDNNGVVKNTTIPESMLAKKHNAFNYHAVREAVAAKIIRVGKEDGMTNLANLLFTKVLTADRRRALCRHIMY